MCSTKTRTIWKRLAKIAIITGNHSTKKYYAFQTESGLLPSGPVIEESRDEEPPAGCNDKVEVNEWASEEGGGAVPESNGRGRHSTARCGQEDKARTSSFVQKILDACHVVETGSEQSQKTIGAWLKCPGLYKVIDQNKPMTEL